MTFTLAKAEGFEKAPPFYQEIAERYLTSRRFESFDEALGQLVYGQEPLSNYFQVMPVSVQPNTLPAIVSEAEIRIILKEGDTGVVLDSSPEACFPILKARAILFGRKEEARTGRIY